jgi:hypothetical protein
MDTSKATSELFAALAKAQAEVENASKNSANPHFRSKYADLAEVLNTVRPVFARHGLSILQGTGFDGELVRVTTVIAHASGGCVSSVFACVPAKTDAQGIGSATTYGRRYSLAAMSGVAQEDDDGNAAAHSKAPEARISDEQVATLADLIEASGTDKAKFLDWLKIKSLADLPAARFDSAAGALRKKLEAAA